MEQSIVEQILRTLLGNYYWIAEIVMAVIALASVIVKITPTLKDDNIFLPIVKIIGKYIALNKYGPSTR